MFKIHSLGEDEIICNDEKLVSGSTAAFVRSCEKFMSYTVFGADQLWPSTILAPAFLHTDGPNVAIEVSLRHDRVG